MATLVITNLTAPPVFIPDVGIEIPGAGLDTITDPSLIRDLAVSRDLRTLVALGTLALSDGISPVSIQALLQYWQGAGFQFPALSQVLFNERWWMIQQNGGLTTLNNAGFTTAPTATGTATVVETVTAQFIDYLSAAALASQAGWVSTAFSQTRFNYRPSYKVFMRTGPSVADVRIWMGLFSATPATASDPVISGMGFRYDTGVDGTAFWRCWTNDGVVGGLATTTTVPIVADTSYVLSVVVALDGLSVSFFIDDVLVATHAANLPGAAIPLGHVERVTNLVAVAKSVRLSKVALSQRAA